MSGTNRRVRVQDFISEWWGKPGGRERSNFPVFIGQLCKVLGVDEPGRAEAGKLGAYEYEGPVPGGSFRSLKGTGSIDLYKRGHFIMEAKQSYLKETDQDQLAMDLEADAPKAPSGAGYDKLMKMARRQADNYAKHLPSEQPFCPFIVVCDIGRAFEIYVDTTGNGRGYDFFPDRQTYRIELTDLACDAKVARTDKTALEILKAIWTDPKSIDPRFHAAEVTRKVARNLAEVSKYLEEGVRAKGLGERERNIEIEESSLFLMRVLFCMFAEDIGLLPPQSFEEFLKEAEGNDGYFANGLRDLFEKMNNADPGNRFSMALKTDVRFFNGGLFEDSKTYPLGGFLVHNLYEAARQNWRRVEPAIFGTLLEQALDPVERSKLGAHYTPRPYVELLVRATILDVLEPEWEEIEELPPDEILPAAQAFHEKLAATRVLDPACGTGNFLYVAMELLQALESKVIERILTLGGEAQPLIGPQQFYGLELNPRAAKIAELVLWIGWLRNRLRDDPDDVPEPVLKRSANLNMGRKGRYDAILGLTETGEPDFDDPKLADWPEAEFIVGNPPFIGKGSAMREFLGDDYVEALAKANPRVAASADFVMQWWDRAANLLMSDDSKLKRFGLVTTNSITQEFNRRVISRYLDDSADGLSLMLAIPDHPWTKATRDAAAVRIAMTVAERAQAGGALREVTNEAKLDTDNPEIVLAEVRGRINADLSVGADLTTAKPLKAMEGLSCNGMMLAGQGFKVLPAKAAELAKESGKDVSRVLRGYIGGGELLRGTVGFSVIDFCGLSEKQARQEYPILYDHLYRNVKPDRDRSRDKTFKENWWLFGRVRPQLREANEGLDRYIGTTETSKHRVFQFIPADTLPDHMVVAISTDDGFHLGVLQSHFHLEWALRAGGLLEDRPRYNKASIFDPFPFPVPTEQQRNVITDIAEELDETRKLAITDTEKLTMTELYNLRDKLRSGEPMSEKETRRASTARAGIVNRLHEQLDQAVADAYGWGDEWAAGQLGPSEIVSRLVALNHERAREEEQGQIRWLRPDYQVARFAQKG